MPNKKLTQDPGGSQCVCCIEIENTVKVTSPFHSLFLSFVLSTHYTWTILAGKCSAKRHNTTKLLRKKKQKVSLYAQWSVRSVLATCVRFCWFIKPIKCEIVNSNGFLFCFGQFSLCSDVCKPVSETNDCIVFINVNSAILIPPHPKPQLFTHT